MTLRRNAVCLRLVAAGAVLTAVAPPARAPHELADGIRASGSPAIPPVDAAGSVVFGLCAVLGWLLLGYLVLIAVLACASRGPGRLGACADSLGRRLTPALLRGLVSAFVGVGAVAGAAPAMAGPAAHSGSRIGSPLTATEDCGPPWAALLDRPGTDPVAGTCFARVGAPVSAPPPATAATTPIEAGSSAGPYVVRPGDSLWSVAAEALGPRAGAARVAASWPAWWAANRSVVGPDPSRLHPGELLVRPD